MAKTKIFGDSVVITSSIKLADLNNVAKYAPKALVLKGGEDNKEDIFMIGVAKSGAGSIGEFGASFAPSTRDAEGYATITMMIPASVKDAKAWMVDDFGGALMNLWKVEEALPAVVAQIAADKMAVEASIEV